MFALSRSLIAGLALALALPALTASAHEFKVGELTIGHPWSRATPGGAKVGAGYFTIENKGDTPDRLVAATAAVADRAEIHEMAVKDGVATMRLQADGVVVPAHGTVAFSPGAFHLMLMGLKAPLKQGDKIPGTLTFEKAGTVAVTFNVEAMGYGMQGADPHAGHMPAMP